MKEIKEKFQLAGNIAMRGLLLSQAPTMAKGMLNEVLHKRPIEISELIEVIEKNGALWDYLGKDYQKKLKSMISRLGAENVKWLTAEWVIEAIKEEHPALASLFLGWRKAKNWLGRQFNSIKQEVEGE